MATIEDFEKEVEAIAELSDSIDWKGLKKEADSSNNSLHGYLFRSNRVFGNLDVTLSLRTLPDEIKEGIVLAMNPNTSAKTIRALHKKGNPHINICLKYNPRTPKDIKDVLNG